MTHRRKQANYINSFSNLSKLQFNIGLLTKAIHCSKLANLSLTFKRRENLEDFTASCHSYLAHIQRFVISLFTFFLKKRKEKWNFIYNELAAASHVQISVRISVSKWSSKVTKTKLSRFKLKKRKEKKERTYSRRKTKFR